MAMPNSVRMTRKEVKLQAKPLAASNSEYSNTTSIKIGLRPYLSARRPKMNAPTARVASVSVIAKVIDVMETPKVLATSLKVKIRIKKSNASRVQLRKAAMTTFRALFRFSAAVADIAFQSQFFRQFLPC